MVNSVLVLIVDRIFVHFKYTELLLGLVDFKFHIHASVTDLGNSLEQQLDLLD
jgi:hypothetical protein